MRARRGQALDDGSNSTKAYPAFEPKAQQVVIAKDMLPSLDEDFIKHAKSQTRAKIVTIAHTMKGDWDVGSLTTIKKHVHVCTHAVGD